MTGTPTFVEPPSAGISYDSSSGEHFVAYAANRSDYSVSKTASGYVIRDNAGSGGTDSYANIDRIKFTDVTVNLNVQANAASIATTSLNAIVELYTAYFNRAPDADGLNYWVTQFKNGMSVNTIGDNFYAAAVSPSYSSLTGYSDTMSNSDFVVKIYQNVLARTVPATDSGVAYWAGNLANGVGRGSVVNQIIAAAHTYKGDPNYGAVADLLDNKLAVAKTFAISDGLSYISPSDSISHGMQITAAVTASDTSAAIRLIGVADLPLGA